MYVSAGTTYFTVTPTTGQVRGTVDAKTHTVSVDFNTIPHGTTVTGQIAIVCTSANNSPQYINLTAQDAISRHIQFISIEQGIDYIPGASDENAVTGNCDGLGLAGDFDCDGFVDFIDFAIFAQQWGQTGSDLRADISPSYKDGSVDINDFNVFSSHWLQGRQDRRNVRLSLYYRDGQYGQRDKLHNAGRLNLPGRQPGPLKTHHTRHATNKTG